MPSKKKEGEIGRDMGRGDIDFIDLRGHPLTLPRDPAKDVSTIIEEAAAHRTPAQDVSEMIEEAHLEWPELVALRLYTGSVPPKLPPPNVLLCRGACHGIGGIEGRGGGEEGKGGREGVRRRGRRLMVVRKRVE